MEFTPILILVFVCAACIASAIVLSIHNRRSLLSGIDDKDFFDEFIEKKKRALNARIGGLSWSQYVTLLTLCPLILGFCSYLFLTQKALCIVFAFLGLFIPECIVRFTTRKQKANFEERYAQALKALASSLRSGQSIEQAVVSVGTNPFVDEHIRKGFRQIASDIKVGIPLSEAFQRFADESDSEDAADVAAAITMQARVGGSEARVIGAIAQNINARILLRKEIKALFAETQVLILMTDILPWAIFLVMYLLVPQFITPYFEDPLMTVVLIAILVFTTLGSFIIHKLANSVKGGR